MASIDFSATSSMYLFSRAITRHLPFSSSLTKPCILTQNPKLGLRFSVSAGIPQIHGNGRKASRGYSGVVGVSAEVCRENWLSALSMVEKSGREENAMDVIGDLNEVGLMNSGECVDWTIGVDPDVKGAIALLKGNGDNCSAEVFDSPHLQVLVGKGMRRRLNAKAIVNLLRSLEAPIGTVAYLEQPTPFPKDGKQGWYSGGFGYGLWIGVLVASGFSVVPISSYLWKKHFELAGKDSLKDESRKKAIDLFPSLDSMLKRKKDHGRAEALLIAAYGKVCKEKILDNGKNDISSNFVQNSC